MSVRLEKLKVKKECDDLKRVEIGASVVAVGDLLETELLVDLLLFFWQFKPLLIHYSLHLDFVSLRVPLQNLVSQRLHEHAVPRGRRVLLHRIWCELD